MQTASGFRELIRRVRDGDQQAATQLVRDYEPHIRRAVRVRLTDRRLRQVIDSVDITQSVLGNFFVRAASGQFALSTPEQLVALLVTMAENRLRDWHRRQTAQRRNKTREVSLSSLREDPAAAETPESFEAGDVNPGELLRQVRERLPAAMRRLAERRSAGESWESIARNEGRSPDALRMQLRRALDRVCHELHIGG